MRLIQRLAWNGWLPDWMVMALWNYFHGNYMELENTRLSIVNDYGRQGVKGPKGPWFRKPWVVK